MDEGAQRQAVVAAAMSWLGTPYHHQADIPGPKGGVDCAMLIVRVFVDCGLVPPFDPRPYPIDWHLHRDTERYLGFIFERARAVETPGPGDVAVFRYGRAFSHGGIVTGWPFIVHAFLPERKVALHDVSRGPLGQRPRKFFSYWGREAARSTAGEAVPASAPHPALRATLPTRGRA